VDGLGSLNALSVSNKAKSISRKKEKAGNLAASAQHADSRRALLPTWTLGVPYQVFEVRGHAILTAPMRPNKLVALDTAKVRL